MLNILDPFLHKEPNMFVQILEKKWKDSGIIWEAKTPQNICELNELNELHNRVKCTRV